MNSRIFKSIFFVLILLISKVGLALNVHHCGGQISKISMAWNAKRCHMKSFFDLRGSEVRKSHCCKDKILHIKFSEKFYKIYKNKSLNEIFIISDVTSHLTDDAYREIYFPQIFSVCCN